MSKYSEKIETNPGVAIEQTKEIIQRHVAITLFPNPSGLGFYGKAESETASPGIFTVNAKLLPGNQIMLALGVFKMVTNPFASFKTLLEKMSRLGERVWITQAESGIFEIRLKIDATPMGKTRQENLQQKLIEINGIAKYLQSTVAERAPEHLSELYDKIPFLTPVIPCTIPEKMAKGLKAKINKCLKLFMAGIPLAITSENRVESEYFLSMLATQYIKRGENLGIYSEGSLLISGIQEVLKKAPGSVVIPSVVLSLGSNAYDRAGEIDSMMNQLARAGTPVIFSGSFDEHQAIFGSGQGQKAHPLRPAIIRLHSADFAFQNIVHFVVEQQYKLNPALHKVDRKHVTEFILKLHSGEEVTADDVDLLPPLVKGFVNENDHQPEIISAFLKSQKETFRGLNVAGKKQRSKFVQDSFIAGMQSGKFPEYVSKKLVGQDKALQKATQRLYTEFLSRPAYQPARMLLQGLPGVGKSEFSRCIADYFGIPHVSIDTASLQSHHEASSLLLGSGRGLVQSFMPGKIELVAGHHEGCVVEIADLDHATPSIRSFLADLFLHILETGTAQTAIGKTVSCSSLIMVFTINLPGGKDETVLRGLGFNSALSDHDILHRTLKEMKAMFSSAFISRVGNPVLFNPFSENENAAIMEMALQRSAETVLENIRLPATVVKVAPGTGRAVLNATNRPHNALGARGIYDLARDRVTNHVMEDFERFSKITGKSVTVSFSNNKITIK